MLGVYWIVILVFSILVFWVIWGFIKLFISAIKPKQEKTEQDGEKKYDESAIKPKQVETEQDGEKKYDEAIDGLKEHAIKMFEQFKIPKNQKRTFLKVLLDEESTMDEETKKKTIRDIEERIKVHELAEILTQQDDEDISNNSRSVPTHVRDEVWRRDEGKCVKCGSRENLEFDHIIPVSKGGSNTARNIELLCEKCNRSKSAKIK
jgi:hypothetical protein